jgi:hypothetical protein
MHRFHCSALHSFYDDIWVSPQRLPHKAGRMMMNIRGLILDDPEHTVHLRTLQFAARTNSTSEIDEEV